MNKKLTANVLCFFNIHKSKRYLTTSQEVQLNDFIIIRDHYQCNNCNKELKRVRTSYYK